MVENKQLSYSVAIIGGGVSSVAAALTLPSSFKVDIYEREARALKKLLKTGNGKANIYHEYIREDSYNHREFIARHPHMLDVVKDFYERHGLLTFSDEVGRAYPYSRSARSMAHFLLDQLGNHVHLYLNTEVKHVVFEGGHYVVDGKAYDALIIATGSSAYEVKYSNDNDNGPLLKQLGLNMAPFHPTSGPLLIEDNLRAIENEKVKAILTLQTPSRIVTQESGEILFKKDALSGIASFIASSRMTWDQVSHPGASYQVTLNLIAGDEDKVLALLKRRTIHKDVYRGIVSDALARFLFSRLKKNPTRDDVMHLLTHLTFDISREEALSADKGQLMNGGISLSEINPHTFEAKRLSNLYLSGEVLDIDGVSGGYNLMFALYSGVQVAKSIIDKRCQLL